MWSRKTIEVHLVTLLHDICAFLMTLFYDIHTLEALLHDIHIFLMTLIHDKRTFLMTLFYEIHALLTLVHDIHSLITLCHIIRTFLMPLIYDIHPLLTLLHDMRPFLLTLLHDIHLTIINIHQKSKHYMDNVIASRNIVTKGYINPADLLNIIDTRSKLYTEKMLLVTVQRYKI